jgi:serine/threonine-protein kinase PpkA
VDPASESALAVQDSPVQTPGIDSATKSSDKSAQAIDQWLQAADQALHEYRLTTPRNDNAYAYYRKVIELDPAHEQARAGITRIAERYAAMARRELNRKNRRLSRLYVRRGIDVQSDHSELLALRAELDESDRARVASRKPPPQHQRDAWDRRKGTGNIIEDFKNVWRSIFN